MPLRLGNARGYREFLEINAGKGTDEGIAARGAHSNLTGSRIY